MPPLAWQAIDFTFGLWPGFYPALCGHPNILLVDWNEGPEGKVLIERNPCDEGTAYLLGLLPPRKLVRPRRRTGFAFEEICLYF